MAWLSRVNFTASDVLSYTDVNNLGNDIRAWGGNVNAGGYTLSNVVLELLNISGGSSSSSVLTLLSTTGTGTTDSIVFKTGSQVQRMKITSAGVIVIGSADDLSISRNAAGVLQIGDGGSNSNGTVRATSFTNGTNTVPFGGNNLTTAGAIPYVSSAGVLNQDATALFWDAANDRLGVRTNSPAGPLHIVGASSLGTRQLRMQTSGQTGYWDFYVDFANSNSDLFIRPNNDSSASATTNINASGNWSIGSLSSSTFKLDVAASGSAGTARFYGGSGVSNNTKVVVQAGAGQSTNLQEWQNSGGTVLSSVAGDGTFRGAYNLPSDQGIWYSGGSNARLSLGNNGTVLWNSSATWYGGSNDLSLSRASAGVLQVGDGAANANGYLSAARIGVGTTSPAFPFVVSDGSSTVEANATGGAAFLQSGNSPLIIGSRNTGFELRFRTEGTEGMRLTATTRNLLIGTTTDDGSNKLQVSGSARVLSAGTAALKVDGGTTQGQWVTGTGFSSIGTVTNDPLVFYTNNVNAARFSGSGNFLIGTSADDGFNKLQVSGPVAVNSGSLSVGNGYGLVGSGNSLALVYTAGQIEFRSSAAARLMTFGSTGVISIYNETATTGVTRAVIRAGAGQSATNLTEWQDSGGILQAYVSSSSSFQTKSNISVVNSGNNLNFIGLYTTGLQVGSDKGIFFSASTEATSTKDLGLARNAAGVLEVNNGTAGTYRDLILRRSQHNGVTVSALPAAAAGNAGSIQYVTDANATTIGSTVVGGGANKVMVWSDGAAWKIFAS